MNIIGITGGSGAGKSTISTKLSQILPNCKLISCDTYMMDLLQKKDKEIFKNLNIIKEQGVFSSNYFFDSENNLNIFIDTIKYDLVDIVRNEISESTDNDYIIIDWVFLPLCDLFNQCDITINVYANRNIRLKRLQDRLNSEKVFKIGGKVIDRYKEGILEKRIKYTEFSNYKYTFTITNEGSIDGIDFNVKKISEDIIKESSKN